MPILKRILGATGTFCFMLLFILFYNVYNQDTYRNFLLILAFSATILILFVFEPATKRVKYAFLAGVSTAICTFILGATGSYIGWYLFLGGTIKIFGVPLEMIIWVFFMGVIGSILSETPKLMRKIGHPISKIFDKVEHSDKLAGPTVIFTIAGFGTLLDYYAKQFGAYLTAPYWTLFFNFFIWLAIGFTTIITYNFLKMPYEFTLLNDQKIPND